MTANGYQNVNHADISVKMDKEIRKIFLQKANIFLDLYIAQFQNKLNRKQTTQIHTSKSKYSIGTFPALIETHTEYYI